MEVQPVRDGLVNGEGGAGPVDGARVGEPDLSQLRGIFDAARRNAGLTFEGLATKSGLSRQTLLNISGGKFQGDLRTWLKLARAFGVSIDELLAKVWAPPKQGERA